MISVLLSTLAVFRKTQICDFLGLFLADLWTSWVRVKQLHMCPRLISLLFQEYIPDLYNHFLDISLEAHMYASQWFLTLFTAKFPLYMVFHIIDLLLCEVRIRDHSTLAFVCSVLPVSALLKQFVLSYFISLLENPGLSYSSLGWC